MRIGRLRARLRRTSAEPEYYSDYTFLVALGEKASICPFDGKAFLSWSWDCQSSKIWYGRSVNGMIPAALIDYGLRWSEWRKKTKANEKYSRSLTRFPWPFDNVKVSCTFNLEGAWIEWSEGAPHITVLETTRVKVKFKAETLEVLLPPGTTVCLSPLPLMQKLGENISIEKHSRRLPTQVMKVFASAKTPLELVARLELEPIRLREKLEDKGEVERRIFSCE